jgi:hypothetical protein
MAGRCVRRRRCWARIRTRLRRGGTSSSRPVWKVSGLYVARRMALSARLVADARLTPDSAERWLAVWEAEARSRHLDARIASRRSCRQRSSMTRCTPSRMTARRFGRHARSVQSMGSARTRCSGSGRPGSCGPGRSTRSSCPAIRTSRPSSSMSVGLYLDPQRGLHAIPTTTGGKPRSPGLLGDYVQRSDSGRTTTDHGASTKSPAMSEIAVSDCPWPDPSRYG